MINFSNSNKLRFEDYLFVFFVCLALLGGTNTTYMFVCVAIFLLTLLVFFIQGRFKNIRDSKLWILFFFLFFAFLVGLINGTLLFSTKRVCELFMFFGAFLFFDSYRANIYKKRLSKVVYLIVAAWAIISINAILFYLKYPSAARIIASEQDAFGDIYIGGGYRIAYGSCLIAVLVFSLLLNKKITKLWTCAFLLLVFAILVMLVILTKSTVTFLALLLGLFLALLFENKILPTVKCVVLFSAFLLVVVFWRTILETLLNYLAASDEYVFSTRFNSLFNVLLGDSSSGDYALFRAGIFLESLNTFAANPLFGVAYLHGNGMVSPTLYGVGNHCEWFDTLANYGLIGGIPYLYLYFSNIRSVSPLKNFRISVGWLISLIIMCTFNPFQTFHSFFAFFFLIPSFYLLIHND